MKLLLSSIFVASLRSSHCLLIPRYPSGCIGAQSKSGPKLHRLSSMSGDTSGATPPVHRILCYGDSLTAGTSELPFELFPYAPHLEHALNNNKQDDSTVYVVRHRGLPGWTADAMVGAADDSSSGLRSAINGIQDPGLSCVIIVAGTNDLGYALGYAGTVPEDQRCSKILTPIKALHEMAWEGGVPRTIAISIPSSEYQSQFKEAAQLASQVNKELEEFCAASEGKAVFVPFPFGYERGGANWSSDGLHFSAEGYKVLGNYLYNPLLKVLDELGASD